MAWVETAICRESLFAKQKFIVAFCSVRQTVKCSTVNNGCTKPCALCTTLDLCGMGGIRWVIFDCVMSSQTSRITTHNRTTLWGGGSRDLIWRSVRFRPGARWGAGWVSMLVKAVCELHFIPGRPMWGRLRKEKPFDVPRRLRLDHHGHVTLNVQCAI